MIFIYASVLCALLAGALYAVWLSWEEAKAERRDRDQQRRQELERVMAITHDLEKRGPTGFQRRAS